VYIDTGSPVPNFPSKSRGLADEKTVLLCTSNVELLFLVSDDKHYRLRFNTF
jgi:hypothetical protein